MNRRYLYIMIILSLLLMPLIISITPGNQMISHTTDKNTITPETDHMISIDTVDHIARTNIIRNPSFERLRANGLPEAYSYWGSSYIFMNLTYKDMVNTGSQAAYVEAAATNASSVYTSLRQYTSNDKGYLAESQVLDMYYNIQALDAINHDAYACINIQSINSSNYYVNQYYVINYGTFNPSNNSANIFYMLNSTQKVWTHLTRNITSDLIAEMPSSVSDLTRRIHSITLSIFEPAESTDTVIGIYDDVRILNRTGYDLLVNSGFENVNPSPWFGQLYSPAYITSTTDSTDGERALNMTINTINGYNGYGSTDKYFPNGYHYFPTAEKSVVIDFDWKYSDTYNGGGQFAYLNIRLNNDSTNCHLYYYLGADMDSISYSNSSTAVYMMAPGFGTRDKWTHFSLDLYDIMTEIGWVNVSFYDIQYYIGGGTNANSTIQLLVDDLEVNAYTFGDPGFETVFRDTPTKHLATWYYSDAIASRVTRSLDSHSGIYSANLTAENMQTTDISRYEFFTRVDTDVFLDLSWKIDSMTSPASGEISAEVGLSFEGGYILHYYLAKSPSVSLSNSTYTSYIFVNNFNTTGTWITNHLNITDHLFESFGDHVWNLTDVTIRVNADSGDKIVFLVDDIGLVDVIAPTINSVSQNPILPMYYEAVEVTVNTQDNRPYLDRVNVYYRTTGSWISVPATESGGQYIATIPVQDYGTSVEYYAEAIDMSGNTVIDDNSGSYYSYMVGDDVDPTVSVEFPVNGTTVTGEVWLNASAEDVGSGIDYVEFKTGGTSIYNDSAAPYCILWNSRTAANGSLTLTVVAHDIAGQTAEDTIILDVQNDVAPPQLTDIILSPIEPQYGEDVLISVGALDVSGITNVTLFYRVNGGSWTSIAMSQSGILYRQTIPAQPYGTHVEYYIVAYDFFGTSDSIGSSTNPLEYTVTDRIAPVLSVSGPSNLEPVRGIVVFQTSSTDLGSGIDKIEFRVDGTIVDSNAGGTFNWNTLDYVNGNHTLVFIAYDHAGNTAEFTIAYQVNNPVGFEGISEGLASIMAQYGFILGASTVVIILILSKIIAKKRGGT